MLDPERIPDKRRRFARTFVMHWLSWGKRFGQPLQDISFPENGVFGNYDLPSNSNFAENPTFRELQDNFRFAGNTSFGHHWCPGKASPAFLGKRESPG